MKTFTRWLSLACLLVAEICSAQNTVILSPVAKQQFFNQSGQPLSYGCVFSFQSGTSTPLATFTDSSGTTQAQNPIILDAGGRAQIWLLAGQAYTLKVVSTGGLHCVTGQTQYSVNGIAGGGSQNVTPLPYSANPAFNDVAQNQLFTMTLTGNAVSLPLTVIGVQAPALITWQITQDGSGNHTFAWPTNVVGGAVIGKDPGQVTTQEFVWNGVNATALGPAVTGANNLFSVGPDVSMGGFSLSGHQLIHAPLGVANFVATGPGAFSNNVLVCGDTNSDLVSCPSPTLTNPIINGSTVRGAPVSTICADPTFTQVAASVTTAQVVKTCGFTTASLNTVGKTIRITLGGAMNDVSGNATMFVGFGPDATLGTYLGGAQITATSGQNFTFSLTTTCTVRTNGATGTMFCTSFPIADSGPTVSPRTWGVTLDLTGPIFIGTACTFTSASTSNICNNLFQIVEQLN